MKSVELEDPTLGLRKYLWHKIVPPPAPPQTLDHNPPYHQNCARTHNQNPPRDWQNVGGESWGYSYNYAIWEARRTPPPYGTPNHSLKGEVVSCHGVVIFPGCQGEAIQIYKDIQFYWCYGVRYCVIQRGPLWSGRWRQYFILYVPTPCSRFVGSTPCVALGCGTWMWHTEILCKNHQQMGRNGK